MTCLPAPPTFRLLDGYVGWDPQLPLGVQGIVGLGDRLGIQLAGPPPGSVAAESIASWLPPARLSVACEPCTLFLASASGLFRRGPCAACFEPFFAGEEWDVFVPMHAVTSFRQRVAVASRRLEVVWILEQRSRQVLARIPVPKPRALAFTPHGDLLVLSGDARFLRFGIDGLPRPVGVYPAPGRVRAIRVARDGAVWARIDGVPPRLYVTRNGTDWTPTDTEALRAAFAPSPIVKATRAGFAIEERRRGTTMVSHWGWDGCPRAPWEPTLQAALPRRGQLLTTAIDSGIQRCQWHRVRGQAEVPAGTSIEVAVAASERPAVDPVVFQPIADGQWQGFAAGVPHSMDWHAVEFRNDTDLDFLIDQPRGRYLYLRVRMTSDSLETPRLERLRLDMPRVTSIVHLPAVYRESQEGETFTERFLSLFDATVEGFDTAVEQMPRLLDIDRVPPQVLPWLARFFDLSFEETWSEPVRRNRLRAALELFRLRGTPEGLRRAIELTFDGPWNQDASLVPVIEELGVERAWGAAGSARLGETRLFGRSRARLRLGTSTLGKTPLRSFGDPDRDAVDSLAHRLVISVPPVVGVSREQLREQLEALVQEEKPAHTVSSIRIGGAGFAVGVTARIGIDTVASPPELAVLNGSLGSVRLGRRGVLGETQAEPAIRLGTRAGVGVHTNL